MITPDHKKIAIIGCAGSGKTYLAFQLQKKLCLPLCHLDQYYWGPNWQRIDLKTFTEIHGELSEKNEWIMEGSYYSTLFKRAFYADVIIFLDMSRRVCLWRVIKRALVHHGQDIPGSPENCKQHLFSCKFLEFLKWIWNFNARYKYIIGEVLLDAREDGKQVYVLRSAKEVDDFVKRV